MKTITFICLFSGFAVLYGCGQTGPLYLPGSVDDLSSQKIAKNAGEPPALPAKD